MEKKDRKKERKKKTDRKKYKEINTLESIRVSHYSEF